MTPEIETHWRKVRAGIAFERATRNGTSAALKVQHVARARGLIAPNALLARKVLGRMPTDAEAHQVMFYGRKS